MKAAASDSPRLRRWARSAVRRLERALHARRRRAAQARLRRGGRPSSVLFVCHGNICRSPYAAAAFQRHLPPTFRSGIQVSSAGFLGPGRAAPPAAVTAAAQTGVDLASHRSRLLSPADIAADWIVVMDAHQRGWVRHWYGRNGRAVILLGDLDPQPIETRAIPDPVDQPQEAFEQVYERIDRCAGALAEVIARSASPRDGL